MISPGFILVILGVLGICFGSFVNAAVWRIRNKRDLVHERSECVHCHHQLSALDLIPVISWLMLRGKCRYCHKKIDDSPLVEIAVLIYFVGSYLVWPYQLDSTLAWIDFSIWLMYGVGLAILFVYDLKWYLLPDKVVWPLVGLGCIDFILAAVAHNWGIGESILQFILALLPIAGVYYFLHAVSKGKWVGFGDVKLGLFIGLALGWQYALACLFIANVVGCLVVIPGLLSKKLNSKSRIPFGPLLIIGCIIAGLWGPSLLDGYFQFFMF